MEKINYVFIAIILLIGVSGFMFHTGTPETGSHTGYITEVGRSGILWSTNFVKVTDSHFSTGGGTGYQSYWIYGLDDSKYLEMKGYQNDKIYKIEYECYLIVPAWQYTSNCVIKQVVGI